MTQIRYIRHDAEHTDKEHLFTDDDGNEVWAVVECGLILPKGENMASFDSDTAQGQDVWMNGYANPKPAHDEVKTTCENCAEGELLVDHKWVKCECCNGDWQSCPNCTEGTGSHNADDVRADMRGHL